MYDLFRTKLYDRNRISKFNYDYFRTILFFLSIWLNRNYNWLTFEVWQKTVNIPQLPNLTIPYTA
jgi:hypothetical protein